jgi:hypothetical protein
MPVDVDSLLTSLKGLDLVVEPFDKELWGDKDSVLVARVSGGPVGHTRTILSANEHVCRFTLWRELPTEFPMERRAALFEQLLRANYEAPFGRVSLASANSPSQPTHTTFIFAETMFFWQCAIQRSELFAEEVRQRLGGLVILNQRVRAEIARFSAADPNDAS